MQIAAILYRLSITFWTGGIALFTFILTPMLFKALSRDQAGQIVGILFPGYFRWGLACGAIALACRLVMRNNALVPACLLVVMLALTSMQAFSIEPRAAALKRQIPSFDTTPKEHPLRREFAKLHGISAVCNLTVVAGGIVLVLL
ncbi:DUF4149 domain-containing protein [Oryzomonas rubra]|uniref:DUF4149 domain-containing protein n=1 Tax=Oryzomonas rubra TaxID=2509454 RepID=A0A5A9X7T2_9BACT|nr:DUF4149 domain-containing protein [Oryzomonas rubra]KAA0888854.1 DUF4149 domain-containing protein [Oryzomonas rubra]